MNTIPASLLEKYPIEKELLSKIKSHQHYREKKEKKHCH